MSDSPEPTFSVEQAAAAHKALRAALNLPSQQFAIDAFVGMISDEIELLRGAGFSDDRIAALVAESVGAPVDAASIARHYAPAAARGRAG